MTKLDKRPYRPDGGDIGIGRIKEIADNVYGDEEKCWLAKRVLELLDDNAKLLREKDVMEAAAQAMRDDMRLARGKLGAAEKRIAELTEKPIGWTDEQELRDVEKLGCGYLFNANPITPHADPRRVILLYAFAAGKGE